MRISSIIGQVYGTAHLLSPSQIDHSIAFRMTASLTSWSALSCQDAVMLYLNTTIHK